MRVTLDVRRGPALIALDRVVDGVAVRGRATKPHARRLDLLLTELATRHEEWSDGFELDTPWCPFTLVRADDGYVLESPRFTGDPRTERTTDLTGALDVLAGWERVCAAARVEPVPVRWDETAVAVVGFEQFRRLTMTRVDDVAPGDSGWFIEPHADEPGDWDGDALERLPAWTLLQANPAIIRAAALPSELAAITEDDGIRVVVERADNSVRAHGLL